MIVVVLEVYIIQPGYSWQLSISMKILAVTKLLQRKGRNATAYYFPNSRKEATLYEN